MTAGDWLEDWLRLTLVPGVGPATQRRLLGKFGTPAAVLSAPLRAVTELLPSTAAESWRAGADGSAVNRALEWVSQPGHDIVTLADGEYPKMLLESADPPVLLYVAGDLSRLTEPALAIVGSRNATPVGVDTAREFAEFISGRGVTIVSGMALGIDSAAHLGGLAGPGGTVAVVGTGVDIVYPARNRELAHRIVENGAIVSEYPLGTRPMTANFPRRNRIISALCRGVLVVEAALRSGSLITARMAAEQGREVMAIPGSIHSPLSRGCHALIKQGARLVESAREVLEEIGIDVAPDGPQAQPATPDVDPLLAAMGFGPVGIDFLVDRTGQSIGDVTARLLELELEGKVVSIAGGRYQRRK